jgi:hypothetical protein
VWVLSGSLIMCCWLCTKCFFEYLFGLRTKCLFGYVFVVCVLNVSLIIALLCVKCFFDDFCDVCVLSVSVVLSVCFVYEVFI